MQHPQSGDTPGGVSKAIIRRHGRMLGGPSGLAPDIKRNGRLSKLAASLNVVRKAADRPDLLNEGRPLSKQSGEGQGWGSVFGFPRRSGDLEINPRPPSPDCLPVYPGLASPSYNTSLMVGTLSLKGRVGLSSSAPMQDVGDSRRSTLRLPEIDPVC